MKYLLLSDIHSNHIALDAVLKHAKNKAWDNVIFLGDAVGYYTHPNEVLDRLRGLKPEINILGNHDDLLLNLKQDAHHSSFKEESIVGEIIQQHLELVSHDNLAYMQSFTSKEVRDEWEVTHGGLRNQWEYLSSLQSAQTNAAFMTTDLCFIGHTHVPIVYACVQTPRGEMWRSVPFRNKQATYRLPPNAKIFFNPGSVGQSRDGQPTASYALFDDENRVIEHFRVDYDVLAVQRLIKEKGYPDSLAKRLTVGK